MMTASSCASDDRIGLDGGFPADLGVDGEANLADALLTYHVDQQDAACMAASVFTPPPEPDHRAGATYSITADELDEAASECDVDLSELWFTHD